MSGKTKLLSKLFATLKERSQPRRLTDEEQTQFAAAFKEQQHASVAETYIVFPSLLEQTTNPIYAHLAGNIHQSSFDDPFKQLS